MHPLHLLTPNLHGPHRVRPTCIHGDRGGRSVYADDRGDICEYIDESITHVVRPTCIHGDRGGRSVYAVVCVCLG